MKKLVLTGSGIIAVLLIGGIAGWFLQKQLNPKTTPVIVRENNDQYTFVNPILFFKTSKTLYTAEFQPLVNVLNQDIQNDTSSHKADQVSVYFNDLNDGHWTGVNENDLYEPSSMLKVITMMGALNIATADPSFLNNKLYYKGQDLLNQYYKPADNLSPGYYSVQELIDEMIINSDNGADVTLLSDKDINQQFQDIYKTFSLPVASSSTTTDFMSPKSYSEVFRTLYNGTFFSPDLDNQILSLLTQTNFKSGLVAGLPSGTVVAHKFGENTVFASNGSVQYHELHDCGIVYYTNRPYLLCVMTKGQSFRTLRK